MGIQRRRFTFTTFAIAWRCLLPTKRTTYKIAETTFAAGGEGDSNSSPTRTGAAAASSSSSPQNASEEDPTQPAVRGVWKRIWVPEKNKHYYLNTETKERTWKVAGTTFE